MNMNIMSRKPGIAIDADLDDERDLALGDNVDEPQAWRAAFKRWLLEDSPYIVMLLLAVVGVALRLQVAYWLTITPVYGVICVIAGWKHFDTAEGHRELVYTQVLNWFALVVAVYILYNTGVQGVLNTSASSLAMMTLLALSTFTAGLLARVWRICALGGLLFVAVPAIGWLDQSVMFLFAAAVVVVAIGALTWWLSHRKDGSVLEHADR
jgi:cation transport ATPase